ncbi:V-type H+-transporting ATPase subunit C, partial [Phenoliferia sp. Uapishka_3]
MAENALWIVSVPLDSSPEEQLEELKPVLEGKGEAVTFDFPQFKTGTLSSLLSLSDALTKHDPTITSTLSKLIDTIRSLTSGPSPDGQSDRSSPLSAHLVIDDGRPYFDYLFPEGGEGKGWQWNLAKYRVESRSLQEVVEGLVKETASIENAQRNKSQGYALVKGQLVTALRKKTGNLSMRSLADVVSEEDFAGTNESEYLETVLVAVPKNLVKEWETSYERLTSMVVPRSSTKLASDDDFVLFGCAIFRKVHDEFAQKCRENKFILRDFTYDADAIEAGKKELASLQVQEKELWSDLLRLSRINFSELFQILVHLKVIRAYVESVLRYGLPAVYFSTIIKAPH